MSWSEIKKKKEEEEKKRASKKSNSDVSRVANNLTGSLWKNIGQNIITSERNAEIRKQKEQQEQKKTSSVQSMPTTYKRTLEPTVTRTMSQGNNASFVKQSDLKNQKLETVQENTTWGNIVNFVKNTGRTLENIKTGAYTNLIGLSQTAIRDISDVDKAYSEGKSAIRNTLLPLLGNKGKQVNNYLNEQEEKNYAKRNEALNSGLQVLSKEKQKANEDIQRNVLGAKLTDSSVATKMAEIAPSIGQQIPGFAFNAISPVASLLYFKGSAEANYYDDAISRGMEEKQAKIYSKLMSYVEAGTEQLSVGNISKGGKTITTALKGAKEEGLKKGLKAGFDVFKETAKEETANTLKSAFKDYGIGVAEEAFQEAITEPIQEFTAMKVAGEDKADWNNMWQRMLQSGFDGALSSAILAGANLGISSCQGIVTKIENGQDFTTEEYNTAIKDASQKIDIEKLTTDQIKEKVNQLKGELQQPQVRVNENVDQEIKTSQNGFSQAEKTEALRQEARNKLESIKQNYDENSYNQMQEFIETAPSEKALNQVINDLNKEAETKQVAPLKQETKNKLEETYKSERFTESQDRKRTYAQYQRQNNTTGIQYDNSVVDNALDAVAPNRNGRRTVGQWKQVAEQIGLNSADLTKSQIDDIAYGSWFDLQPTKNITRYDNRTKEHKGFEKFTSDDWINTIYESAKGQKIKQIDNSLINNEKTVSIQQVTEEDYLTHAPNYYDGEQFDYNEHRNKTTKKVIREIIDIIDNSSNIKQDLIKAYQENEKSEGNHNELKTGLDEDNRFNYQYKESALSNFIDEINKGKNIKESEMYRLMKDYLKEQYSLSEETPQKQEVSLPLNENVVNNQNTSQEQYSLTETQPQNNFKYEQTDNEKVNKLYESTSKYFDDSQKTHNMLKPMEKIVRDKGYNIVFDDTLGDNINGRIRTNQDTGETEITLNPNSSRAGEFILGHELTHAIQTQEMVDLVNQRMQKDGDLKNAVEDLKKLYNTDDINAEVLADISGQLFGNQEFINNLSVEKPSIFKRIYDKIISLANKITGNSNEALFIKDLKNKWEKAYRENTNAINEAQYSKTSDLEVKQQQNKIIQENNPLDKTLGEHTWINSADDIKTYQEAIDDFGGIDNITPDFTAEDVRKALDTGKITIYSSYPIEQGTFVTPSKMEAQSYAGRSQVYSKEVNLSDVAWIDEVQGQYAKVEPRNNNVTTDNQGNELNPNMQKWAKDSKARVDSDGNISENGNLATVYHTTTDKVAQFNEFNPVGTPYYRFGDQVVNYYTDSKDMSGSYSNNRYKTADTKKLNNINEANDYLKGLNDSRWNDNKYYIENKGNSYYLKENSLIGQEALDFLNGLSSNEIKQLRDNIFVNEEFKNTPYGKAFSWNEFDKGLQEKYHNLTNKYLGSDNLIDIQKRMIEYLENPESYNKDKDSYINKYDNEEQLLRNLKQDIQKKDWTNNSNIQYEGYVNITNPYIIDAEGKNWDSVVSKLNKEIEKNISEIKSDTKKVTDLINLQLESEKKYNQYNQNNLHEEYLLQARLVKDLERGLPLDVRNDIEDTYLFGFNFDDYATKTTKNKVEGKNLVKDLLTKYAEEHDANDIREFNTKIEKYGNLTLNEFLKQAHEAYNTDMKYGKEDAYFKSEVEKILNRDITKAFNDDFITGEQLYKLAKEGFSKNAVLDILGEKQTTNDIVKQVIEMNKNGANYDGVIMKNVLDYGGNSQTREPANLYVTFASNQFKAKDNLNPTSDADIRYSKQNQSWQDYLEKNYKSEGTTTDLRDIRLPMKEKQEVKAPLKQGNVQQNQNNNTPGENINWNEIERPENNQKFRKHYRSIIESSNTTAEAKAVAKELMGTDTYTPETNKGQLAQADQRIMTSSPEVELQALRSRVLNGERVTSVDIAVGERLIQYFSKTGSAEQLQDAIQTTALAGTSTGQTLQALTILNHQTPQGQVTWLQRSIDKMNKELAKKKGGTITTDADGNIQIVNKQGKDITNKVDLFNLTPEMMNKIMQSENQEQMYKNIDEVYGELGQQVPKGMLEKIDSWRYFSMLANARTHIRNMVGNLAMGKTQRLKDKLAGGIEDVVSKFNPKMERTKTLRRADKKTKEFAKNDFKNVEVQSRLELNESKFNPQSRLQNARRTFKSDAMENTLGRLFNLNDKLLEAEDGIGLKAGYQKALADYITANKIDVDNITDAQLNKARNYAIQQAKEATFHQANAIASAVAQFENKNLATKLFTGAVLPFKKTPMNVAKAGMEYSPLQIAKSATVDLVNLRKGNISVNQYIDNLSKGMTGTGIALVGYALANAGILKASGGDDKDKEKYEEEQGKQSYSIQIAGKTYSLDWLAPTGIPLFIGAETHKLFNQEETEKSTEKKSEEDRLNQAIKGASNLLNAGATAINPMSEMSMISGLTSALSSYNTSDNLGSLGNIMTNAGKSYVNQFFPTLMGQVAKTTDKYERTTKSTATGTIGKAVDQTINQIKNKIPGLRQTLPIKTDIWGNDVKQEVNLPLRAVNNFINPATVKNVSTDKVDMELNKLYEENHSSSLLPDILTKTVQLNKQTYRLSNKEYAEFTKNYGQISHKLIGDFIKTSDYNKLTQEQKETAISNIYSYAKEQNKMDYAKKVNETVKPSTLYTTMKEIEKNGGKQSEYLSYLAKTKGMSKESEKNKVLADSNYSNRTKEIIYTNGTGKDDNLYNNLLSKSHINMTEYLDYKDKVSNKVFSADKDKNGKTVSGSAKAKVINYLNNNITGVGNRLLIAGKSYALQNNEKQKLAQYINSIANTREERIEIYKQLDKNFYVRNGKVYMRVSK